MLTAGASVCRLLQSKSGLTVPFLGYPNMRNLAGFTYSLRTATLSKKKVRNKLLFSCFETTCAVSLIHQLNETVMTTTQKAFNNIQNRINELNEMIVIRSYNTNNDYVKTIIASLESKLSEIAQELVAERHENNY